MGVNKNMGSTIGNLFSSCHVDNSEIDYHASHDKWVGFEIPGKHGKERHRLKLLKNIYGLI